jgi:hypothetical protein
MSAAPESCLLVPMHVEALVIGASPGADWVDLKPDFRGIYYNQVLGQQLESEPCSTKGAGLNREPGVHLHWALPDGLTHGVAGENGQPAFPIIPNRWLVVRLCEGIEGRAQPGVQHRVWIVESDTITGTGEGATWPAPPAAQPDPRNPTDYAVRVGRRFDLERWPGEGAGPSIDLTAAGYGDPSFAAYYPACREMLGFHDRELDDLRDVDLTYVVAGWYSQIEADPLHAAVASDGFAGLDWFLDAMEWTYPGRAEAGARVGQAREAATQLDDAREMAQRMSAGRPEATDVHAALAGEIAALEAQRERCAREAAALEQGLPGRIVCHGTVSGIRWQSQDALYDIGIPRGRPFRVAVANTFVEALSALFATRLDSRAARLLEAFQYDLVPELEKPGGEEQLEHKLHERGYRPLARGIRWDVIEDGAATSATPAESSAPDVPGDVRVLLENVNILQREINRLNRERDSKRSELYATWYKTVLAPGAADLTRQMAALQQEITDLTAAIAKLEDEREGRPRGTQWDRLLASIDTLLPGYALTTREELRFFRPADPVVLLAGPAFQRASRYGEDGRYRRDGRLACRLDAQACSGVAVSIPNAKIRDVEFGATEIDRWCNPLPQSESGALPTAVSAVVRSLVRETLLLTPNAAQAHDVAAAAYEKNEHGLAAAHPQEVDRLAADFVRWLQQLDDAARSDAGQTGTAAAPDDVFRLGGVYPSPVSIHAWRGNPWLPLFMQWQVRWRASWEEPEADLDRWALDATGTRFSGSAQARGEPQIYAGTTLLTPGAARHLGERLRHYNRAHDDASLRAVEAAVRSMNVLTQSLGGFTDNLLMRQAHLELQPLDPGTDGEGPRSSPVADWVQDIEWVAPLTEGGFFPLRAGELEIEKLWVIDAYGQLLQLESEDAPALKAPVVHERLAGAGGAIRLEPRLAQPARLGIEWLPACRWKAESASPLGEKEPFDPVCGWIVPNLLDRGLMIYDARGRALGALQAVQRKSWDQGAGARREPIESFHWVDLPGSAGFFYGTPPQQIADPLGREANPHLREYVRGLLSLTEGSGAAFGQLLDRMDEALSARRPNDTSRDPGLALLVGRPLALVRARLRLELDGEPARPQGWDAAQTDAKLQGGGLAQVRFPVRLGERRPWEGTWLGEDGLVGFFLECDYTRFYPAYGLQGGNDGYSMYGHVPQIAIDEPLDVTFLMDPGAGVCATTGILPRTLFHLPYGDIAEALDSKEIIFFTGPLVSTAAQIRMPQPSDLYGQWSWTYHPAVEVWREGPITDTRREAGRFFDEALEIAEGWLRLVSSPLAIRAFEVQGREPVSRARKPAAPGEAGVPARYEVPSGERVVLSWSTIGADRIELRAGATTLLESERHPLPSRFRIGGADGGSFTLIARARDDREGAAQEERTIEIARVAGTP